MTTWKNYSCFHFGLEGFPEFKTDSPSEFVYLDRLAYLDLFQAMITFLYLLYNLPFHETLNIACADDLIFIVHISCGYGHMTTRQHEDAVIPHGRKRCQSKVSVIGNREPSGSMEPENALQRL